MRGPGFSATVVCLAIAWACESTRAGISGLQLVASGITAPVYITHAPGDRDRLFIAENGFPYDGDNASARILILNLKTGVLDPTPFATITGINSENEGGLLGMAFHPNYNSTDPNAPGR